MRKASVDAEPEDPQRPIAVDDLGRIIRETLETTPFIDLHTHLFPPSFGSLALSGIDRLLTYHYLEAEFFRSSTLRVEEFWGMTETERADRIWKSLFLENSPVSEATRGVIAVLDALGLDTRSPSLAPMRDFFRQLDVEAHVQRVFELSGLSEVVMTNDPLDPDEMGFWHEGVASDPRFNAALRLDRLLNDWEGHQPVLSSQGYRVEIDGGGRTTSEIRRFLDAWVERMNPRYMAVSLPDSFRFPLGDVRTRLLVRSVIPACRELGMPLALMIGVRRGMNPALRLAGDASGRADLGALAEMCNRFPDNRFLVTLLSRENQHELCVYARKFGNLMPFGCWWFLNNTSIVEEITSERLEMLGTSFIPQHSDARVLEQLIYKWRNTRQTLIRVLTRCYRRLLDDGGHVTPAQVRRDVTRLFRGNFERWTDPSLDTDRGRG